MATPQRNSLSSSTGSTALLIGWQLLLIASLIGLALPELTAILLGQTPEQLRELLMFDRQQIAQGEWWRLYTGQLVHLSTAHALGNSAGLALASYLLIASGNPKESPSKKSPSPNATALQAVSLTLLCSTSVGFGLYGGAPDLERYVGFSGLLHGLLIAAPFIGASMDTRAALIFSAAVTLKVIFEQTAWYDDMSLAGYVGGRVETRSHLFGMMGGWVWLVAWIYLKNKKNKD